MKKASRLDRLLDKIENIQLLKLAESRVGDRADSFELFVKERRVFMEELEELSQSVEFE